jgi:hypothetical protein
VKEVYKYIIGGLIAAFDVVAPVKAIIVNEGSNLYLSEDTLTTMKRRDSAKSIVLEEEEDPGSIHGICNR